MRPRKPCLWAVVVFFVLVKLAAAQDSTEVNIFGFVTEQTTGTQLSGVLVEAINEADTTQRVSTLSDATGRYVMTLNLVTGVRPTPGGPPSDFRLDQNYPNPFNPSTVIQFAVLQVSGVRLMVYNTLGQRVRTLVEETLPAGEYRAIWDATDDRGRGVAAGIYFYQLQTDDFAETKKMVLLDGSSGAFSIPNSSFPSQSSERLLKKSSDLTIRIRATSARVEAFEQRNVVVNSQNFRFDIPLVVSQASPFNLASIALSEPSADGTVYVSGLAKAVIDTVLRTEKVTARNQRTGEEVSMRVNLDGSFPLITMNGIVGDTLTLILFRKGQQVGEEETLLVPNSKPPVVTDTRPTNGDKDIILNALIFIEFSEPIDTTTVTENSLMLADNTGNLSGAIGFLNGNTVAVFSPDESLAPLTAYTITVTTDVNDLQGIPLAEEFSGSFTTGDTLASGGQIAFTRMEFSSGEQGLYTIDTDGGNLERLTKRNDVYDSNADWSPDGRRLVFSRHFEDGHSEIYLMNSDGTFLENLTDDATVRNWDPAFSPDGNRIIFTTNREGNQEIYRMNINGTNLVNLTNTPDLEEAFPDWSPDGRRIVYIVNHSLFVKDIVISDNDGANKQTISSNVPYLFPAWSPDGTEIALASIRPNGFDERIFIMNSDGTEVREITMGASFGGPSWSPDGKTLAFIRMDETFWPAVARIDRDGSNLKNLTPETQDGSFDIWVEGPAWSPWPIRQ